MTEFSSSWQLFREESNQQRYESSSVLLVLLVLLVVLVVGLVVLLIVLLIVVSIAVSFDSSSSVEGSGKNSTCCSRTCQQIRVSSASVEFESGEV